MRHHSRIRNGLVFFVVVLLMLCQSNLQSQPEENDSTSSINSLVQGAWALQFQMAGNFTLTSFQGAVISAKRHLTDKSAIRLGVSLSFGGSDDDLGRNSFQADTASMKETGTDSRSSYSVTVASQYLYYSNPRELVNLFFGAGPQIQFSRYHTDGKQVATQPGYNYVRTNTASRESKAFSIGISSLLGVEWFASKSISLHAEYGLSIMYVSLTESSTNSYRYESPPNTVYSSRDNYETTRKGWDVNGSYVKFGLSVYF